MELQKENHLQNVLYLAYNMKEISAEELKQRLEAGSITALDVREAWEYEEQHINPSMHMSVYEIPERIGELEDYKEKPMVVFCKTGKRGGQAQKLLLQHGFTDVSNLTGGIEAYWELA